MQKLRACFNIIESELHDDKKRLKCCEIEMYRYKELCCSFRRERRLHQSDASVSFGAVCGSLQPNSDSRVPRMNVREKRGRFPVLRCQALPGSDVIHEDYLKNVTVKKHSSILSPHSQKRIRS